MSTLKQELPTPRNRGGQPKLSIEDQLLITLEYWREYRTYFHIAQSWGVHESTVCRIVHRVEEQLIKSRKFSLPGKKALISTEREWSAIIVDVGESPIERPKKNSEVIERGKKKRHTLKSQVVIETESLKVVCTAHGTGKEHDFQLFKRSQVKPLKQIEIIADKGYQGIKKIHRLSYTPIKKKKKQPLASTEKEYNP